VTAYHGLLALGALARKTVAVTGPTGGLGSIAVLLARQASANVVEVHS
jgi:NADPH-dependent curcumin reductase CurA